MADAHPPTSPAGDDTIDLTQASPVVPTQPAGAVLRPRTRSRTALERSSLSAPPDVRAGAINAEVIEEEDESEDEPLARHRRRGQRLTPGRARRSRTHEPYPSPHPEPQPQPAHAGPSRLTRAHPEPEQTPAPQQNNDDDVIVIDSSPVVPTSLARQRTRASSRLAARNNNAGPSTGVNGLALPPNGVRGVDPDGPSYLLYHPPSPPRPNPNPVRAPRRARAQAQAGPSRPRGRKAAAKPRSQRLPDAGEPFITPASTSTTLAPASSSNTNTNAYSNSRGSSPLTSISSHGPVSPKHEPSLPPVLRLPTPPPPKPPLVPLTAYTCPICFSPPTNATVTPCGHLMCGECLYSSVRANLDRMQGVVIGQAHVHPQCPVCRANIHLSGTTFDGGGKNTAVGVWAFEEIELGD